MIRVEETIKIFTKISKIKLNFSYFYILDFDGGKKLKGRCVRSKRDRGVYEREREKFCTTKNITKKAKPIYLIIQLAAQRCVSGCPRWRERRGKASFKLYQRYLTKSHDWTFFSFPFFKERHIIELSGRDYETKWPAVKLNKRRWQTTQNRKLTDRGQNHRLHTANITETWLESRV